MPEQIHIGTSGWHYNHWRGPFYPPDLPASKMLRYYAERFRTVEINNSFYRLPSRDTFRGWREQVPAWFQFAVKANRYITHRKKLKDPQEPTKRMFDQVEGLSEKAGPVLFQLPPGWHRNPERLRDFLKALPGSHHYAFEFRDPTWFDDEIIRELKTHNAAVCVFDLAGTKSPEPLTADFAYLRLHGPSEHKYSGRYTRPELRRWFKLCREWLDQGAREVFVYFDNDQAGYAAVNALELQQMAG